MRSAARRKLLVLACILPFCLGYGSMCGLFLVDPAGVGDGVQGTWIVTHVCDPIFGCSPFPAAGYDLPENKGTVKSLSLQFDHPTHGAVIGRYQMVVNGLGQPLQRQTGSFVFDGNDPGKVTMSALKKQLTGKVVGAKGSKLSFATIEVTYPVVITKNAPAIPMTVRLRR